jgi:hypothetical protein
LHLYETTFNALEIFITKICPNLKCLSIVASNDITFLDAYRWEHLILNYFPYLEKFSFTYDDYIDYGQQYPICITILFLKYLFFRWHPMILKEVVIII